MKSLGEELQSGFVGHSPRILQIRAQLEKLAARTLFNAFPRGHFVPVDCASLVGTMMESELFGHVRGAFTGAVDAKKGLLEHAHGGTAFFDEIGELPLELQAKLLRVLQEHELRPVG